MRSWLWVFSWPFRVIAESRSQTRSLDAYQPPSPMAGAPLYLRIRRSRPSRGSVRDRKAPPSGDRMDETQPIKSEVIAAFFDNADARVAFLAKLADKGHSAEAMTLCLTYIDSFSHWLCWPATSYFKDGAPTHAGKWHDGQVRSKWGERSHLWQHGVYELPLEYGSDVRPFMKLPRPEIEDVYRQWVQSKLQT